MKRKTVKVKLDPSTWRWLRALAEANSNTELNGHEVKPGDLLGQAAFCIADAAGRHHGWRADVGGHFLHPTGYQGKIPLAKVTKLQTQDRRSP